MQLRNTCITALLLMGLVSPSTRAQAKEDDEKRVEEPKRESVDVGNFSFRALSPFESDRRRVSKIDFFSGVSRKILIVGTVVDGVSTGISMSHPTIATRIDGTVLASYHGTETGWAKCFGERNTAAAVAANVLLNVAVDLVSRKLDRKGGHLRILAAGLRTAKGILSLKAGIDNFRSNADVDRRVRNTTGYTGPVLWSR